MRSLLALVALLVGCGSPTELLLVVKAGPGVVLGPGGDIDQIHVQAQPASDSPAEFFYSRFVDLCTVGGTQDCQPTAYVGADYQGGLTLPVRFYFEPGAKGMSEDIRIWVDGYANGKPVLADGLRFQFSPGRRLWLEVVLYHSCLGDLTCEAQDLACGVDRDCVMLTTSPTEPVDDLGPSSTDLGPSGTDLATGDGSVRDLAPTPGDLASGPIDMALPCGTHEATCCPTNMCGTGLMCTQGRCIMQGKCGELGDACCNDDGGMTCNTSDTACNGAMCVLCGGDTQTCCAGDRCDDGFSCRPIEAGMICMTCGASGEACCPSSSAYECGSGLGCYAPDAGASGTCTCGFIGGPCCYEKVDAGGMSGTGFCPISGMCEAMSPAAHGAGASKLGLTEGCGS